MNHLTGIKVGTVSMIGVVDTFRLRHTLSPQVRDYNEIVK